MAASKLLLVDGTNTLYRAFFAIPHLRAPDGTPTNAAYGMINTLTKVIREERPDRVIVVFDARGKSFRNDLYEDYKAHRESQPEDLSLQIPIIHELIEAHRFPIVTVPDFEADDVIATLVARAPDDTDVVILSTDKDLMQLVSDRVHLLDGVKDRRYGPAEVEERFGVPPSRILDLRSLVGDPSDNIPGVKGIGEKGAAKLIDEFGSLEELIARRGEVKAKRARTALEEHLDEALLSKRLATLRFDAPLPDGLDDPLPEPDVSALRELYTRLGFVRLIDGLAADAGASAHEPEPIEIEWVRDREALAGVVEEMGKLPTVPLVAVIGAGGAIDTDAVGLAVALGAQRAAYVVLAGNDALAIADVAEAFSPLLAAPGAVSWIARDSKELEVLFGECGVELPTAHFDVSVAAQLIDPAGSNNMSTLCAQQLGRKLRSWEDLAGRGAKAIAAAEIPVDDLAAWAVEEVCALRALHAPLQRRLDDDGLAPLFEQVELPLCAVLARMHRTGVRIDEPMLEALDAEWERELGRIQQRIYELAGEEFLVSSPKQLQQILFEKLKLPPVKKTKTGYSTDESVLETLALQHDLPAMILEHRKLAKLRSTYVTALPPLVNPRTGRIHPTFNQLGAATGRLSATNPNVQNIPIRSAEGIRIREAFVPAEGKVLLSADYSQVELRLLAHYCGDPGLVEAFVNDEDIHLRTAAEVAQIPIADVSPEQRERAKATNFGIIYGLSAFGLANQLGIATDDARATIDAYFERYSGVRAFIDTTIEQARKVGHVVTMLGRRRYLPDLASRNRTLRQAAERMAVNSILQGTAADLIKKAMVALDAAIAEVDPGAAMILQVHDELVFEVPPAGVDALTERVVAEMEGVADLRVPLRVHVGTGANWREAH